MPAGRRDGTCVSDAVRDVARTPPRVKLQALSLHCERIFGTNDSEWVYDIFLQYV